MAQPTNTPKREWRKIVAVVLATLAIPIIPFLVVGELPGQQWLEGHSARGLGVGGTGAVLLAMDVLLPIPSSLVGTLMGARLGVAAGFAWVAAGLIVGHLIGFALGRLWPARFAPTVAQAPTGLAVFLSRPVPVFAEAVAIAAGAARLPLGTYVLWCVSGDALYALVLAANGAQFLPENMVVWALLLPMALPVISWLAWRVWQRRKRAN
ncbi:MAG: hypothetical protein SF187_07510 [Deltaproteobacteria bacterium]|nr:hypothetical protein [Deltaproteobacteria bacterium]